MAEVAQILALGVLRLLQTTDSGRNVNPQKRDISLDFSGEQSVHADVSTHTGERF